MVHAEKDHFVKRYRFQFLVGSIAFLLFGDLLIPEAIQSLKSIILILPTLIFGPIMFVGNRIILKGIILVAIAVFVLEIISLFVFIPQFRLLYIVFFLGISTNLYRQIYLAKDINAGMISAVFSGFMILGLIGGILFVSIEGAHPGSFANLNTDASKIEQLNYFSFVSILTIGYGDIAPLTTVARKCTLILGLLGHFYTVFIIGIIIGKYLGQLREKRE